MKTRMQSLMKSWMRFNAVGAAGILVQLGALSALVRLGLGVLPATALAVEAAILHNLLWHGRCTWADRPGVPAANPERALRVSALKMLLRFHLANGAVSLIGNVVFMGLLTGVGGLAPVAANLLSIAACSLINFVLADRLVFIPHSALRFPHFPRVTL